MNFLVTTIVMFAFWILLSGFFDLFHLSLGIVSSMLVSYFSRDLLFRKDVKFSVEFGRILRFFLYLPWLFKEIIKSNLSVAYLTLHPKMPISPRLIKVKTGITNELGIVTYANSVTLTPGTVTIWASSDGEFLVHAITKEAADELLGGEMARRVKAIRGPDV